jgi:hypothetical protein
MLGTPSPSSTATSGRAATLRCAKIVSLATLALVDGAALEQEHAVVLLEALEPAAAAASALVVVSAVASEDAEDSAAAAAASVAQLQVDSMPSNLIYVRNLPWSTSNEDLVELFTTIGKVTRAEIQYEPNGRSRGTGVVEFEQMPDAETAIGMCLFPALSCNADFPLAKFTGYQYGGRPLGLSYVKYTNQNNGDVMEGTEHTGGLTQDQIM